MGRGKHKDEDRRNYVPWLAGAVVAACIGAAIFQPKPSEKPVEKASVQQPVQIEQRVNLLDKVQIQYFHSDISGKVEGFKVLFNSAQLEVLANNAPVYYEVPGIKLPTHLPFEQGMTSFRTKFPKPESIDGKVLVFYNQDPYTNQRRVLFQGELNTR